MQSRAGGAAELFVRLQLVGAFLLGILLLAVPLYLWRRPRSAPPASRPDAATAEPPRDVAAAPSALPEAPTPPKPVRLEEARILECHDPGTRRIPVDQCDHIPALEKALADAIEATHGCVPPDAGMGSIEYVADVAFGAHRNGVTVALPRDGRSFKNPKIVKSCAAGVRSRLSTLPLEPLAHAHSRYKLAVIASYPGPQGS